MCFAWSFTALAEPTAQEIAEARTQVNELFKNDLRDLYTKKITHTALADKFLNHVDMAESDAAKHVLLESAWKYYFDGKAYVKAAKVLDRQEILWKNMTNELVRDWGNLFKYARGEDLETVFEHFTRKLKTALASDDAAIIEKYFTIVRANHGKVWKTKSYETYTELQKEYESKKNERSKSLADTRLLEEKLNAVKAAPRNRILKREYAEMLVTLSDDWGGALPYFAQCDDADLATMARLEQSAKGSADVLKIADFFWERGEKERGPLSPAYKRHAVSLYESMIADLSGLKLKLVEKRIASLEPAEVETAPAHIAKGKTFDLPGGNKLEMRFILKGDFMMGSPANELGRWDNEVLHRVTLTQDFWIGKYKVTQRQWKAVMGSNPSKMPGDDFPIDQVKWSDALAFCAKLNDLLRRQLPRGYEFTLPTEAQWEYACRAGTTSALPSGKELTDLNVCPNVDALAWTRNNSGSVMHSVGGKLPNAWGLYDMLGNAFEWCYDSCDEYPQRTNLARTSTYVDGVKDPLSTKGARRVLRGGCWQWTARRYRSAMRFSRPPEGNNPNYVGLRVVLAPTRGK